MAQDTTERTNSEPLPACQGKALPSELETPLYAITGTKDSDDGVFLTHLSASLELSPRRLTNEKATEGRTVPASRHQLQSPYLAVGSNDHGSEPMSTNESTPDIDADNERNSSLPPLSNTTQGTPVVIRENGETIPLHWLFKHAPREVMPVPADIMDLARIIKNYVSAKQGFSSRVELRHNPGLHDVIDGDTGRLILASRLGKYYGDERVLKSHVWQWLDDPMINPGPPSRFWDYMG